ncbi:MAG: tetratricopeptide repeat protein [Proteobacteria bacterium]|nr:tetratricopeptide repeat protein [Pseudomonadota bacterium]MDA0994609.1 tetratricopeptide repeat protein [Pseudomonadota bacterium]
MKFGLLVIVALIISAIGANFLLQDPGYVVINFRGYLVEMSVPVLVALVVSLFLSIWLVVKLFHAPRKLGEAAARYRAGRAGLRLTRGVIEVAEGNFAKGERLLARAAGVSEAPLLNYLQAARAAHLLGQSERRDTWLKQAYENLPGATNAVLLTQAEFQLDQQQYEQALATLRKIEENTPNHSHALMLLGRLYFRLEDWKHLSDLLPKLTKLGRLDPAILEKWSLRVHQEHLASAADGDAVNAAWKQIPRQLKQNVALLESYYTNLIRTNMHEKAEKELEAELKRGWRAPLVRLYGIVEGKDAARQLKKAEGWLTDHGDDADLLLSAARLCLRAELWGKARSYLETVIGIRPTPDAYQLYGRLLRQLGEGEAAAEAYRTGLGLVAQTRLPAIPHLKPDPG